jgi:hypothetical protein
VSDDEARLLRSAHAHSAFVPERELARAMADDALRALAADASRRGR